MYDYLAPCKNNECDKRLECKRHTKDKVEDEVKYINICPAFEYKYFIQTPTDIVKE